MTRNPRAIAVVVAVFVLSGCAAAGASLDRFAEQAQARSNCHTSTGELIRAPSCTVSYTVANTTTTSTTTTTTAPPTRTDD